MTDPDRDAARAAGELARDIAAREIAPHVDAWGAPDAAGPPGDVGRALADAGLLDADLEPGVRVEVAFALGRAGLRAALTAMDVEPGDPADPMCFAAALAGAGDALVECGIAYAKERVVFGRPLAKMPVQRSLFAAAAADIDAAIALCRRAAVLGDPLDVASALPCAADAAWRAAETALQVHGGYGYTDEYPVSRMWREVAAARTAIARGASDDLTWGAITAT
ncbi:MAG TPA: acyl-CoA dehydrogenase family protein [Mycobacteriales bacterium]|nr:acyl-CoA dehydrogenase family protein [Mycobacteriales bacterium]